MKRCTDLLSCRQFLREFHYSRFWFASNDWRSLVYIPWLPYKWQYQMFHVFYRWFIACYFLGSLITSGVESAGEPRWLIFLTNWTIVGFNIYLVLAALSVTAKFISSDSGESRLTQYDFDKPVGCCGYGNNRLSWYQMIHWASFAVFGDIALAILILFWSLLYRGGPISGTSINHHLVNGIVIIVDVLFFGVPVSLLHFIYPVLYMAIYAIFTGIYWAAGGTNQFDGGRYVYSVLDYSGSPTFASIIVVCVVVLFMPLMHLILYSLHIARFWLVYAIYGRTNLLCWREQTLESENVQMKEKTDSEIKA